MLYETEAAQWPLIRPGSASVFTRFAPNGVAVRVTTRSQPRMADAPSDTLRP